MAELLILSILCNLVFAIAVIRLYAKLKSLKRLSYTQFQITMANSTEEAQQICRNIDLMVENESLKNRVEYFEQFIKYLKEESKKEHHLELWLSDRCFYFTAGKIRKEVSNE
jgi:hypothetical protein